MVEPIPVKAERIRVLQLVQGLAVGGLEMMVKRLVEGLDPARFKTTVCCFDVRGELADDVERAGVDVVLLARRPGVDWRYPLRLARVLRRHRIDLVHLHNDTALLYGSLAAILARTRAIVYTEHDRNLPGPWRIAIINSLLARRSQGLVTVSETIKEALVQYEWFPTDRVEVIANGVPRILPPDEAVRRQLRCEMGAHDGDVLIGTVGRLTDVKDHAGLIGAVAQLVQRHPRARLAIIGSGELRDSLQSEIDRRVLGSCVRLLGQRRDVGPYLHAMDVFALSSKSEGLPLSLLEAMAAGRPIVSTCVGGIGEAIQDGREGFLVGPGDYAQFVNRISRLIDRPRERRRMGDNALRTFEARYSVGGMVEAYRDVYERALRLASNRSPAHGANETSSRFAGTIA